MNNDQEVDVVRRRMAELRRELTGDVREVGRSAREMTDWTFYVRRFPWAVAAIAAAAGYLLIPRKKQVIAPDPDAIAELVKKNVIRVETKTHESDSPKFIKSLLMMGVTWAAKAGMNYMSQRLQNSAAQQREQPPQPPPTPSPLEEPWPQQETNW